MWLLCYHVGTRWSTAVLHAAALGKRVFWDPDDFTTLLFFV